MADLESLAEETRQAGEEARRTSQSLEAAKEELEARLAAKEAELARLAQTRQDLETQLEEEIRKGEIELRRIQDKLQAGEPPHRDPPEPVDQGARRALICCLRYCWSDAEGSKRTNP